MRRIILYDTADTSAVSYTWALGTPFYKAIGACLEFYPVKCWAEATQKVSMYTGLDEIQFWGHGSPGCALIGKEHLSANDNENFAQAVKQALKLEGALWFRTCASFAGDLGKEFAKSISSNSQRRCAGSTFKIGMFHSGIHSCLPNWDANWLSTEGIDPVTKKPTSSGLGKPNTILCLQISLPKSW